MASAVSDFANPQHCQKTIAKVTMAMTTDDRKSDSPPVTRDEDGSFTVDAAFIGPKLGVEPGRFMALLREGRIVQATESGTGPEAGTWRLTFTWAGHRWRLVVDDTGRMLSDGPATGTPPR